MSRTGTTGMLAVPVRRYFAVDQALSRQRNRAKLLNVTVTLIQAQTGLSTALSDVLIASSAKLAASAYVAANSNNDILFFQQSFDRLSCYRILRPICYWSRLMQ